MSFVDSASFAADTPHFTNSEPGKIVQLAQKGGGFSTNGFKTSRALGSNPPSQIRSLVLCHLFLCWIKSTQACVTEHELV